METVDRAIERIRQVMNQWRTTGAPTAVRANSGGSTYVRSRVNLIGGTNVTVSVADDQSGDEVDVTLNMGGAANNLTVEEADGSPSLAAISVIRFDQADGFVVSNPAAGVARIDFTGGAASGITVEEVDGAPTYASVTTLRFDQADGFVVSQPGAGIARVDFTPTPQVTLGTVALDFGAFPGVADAAVAVTGQAAIGASAKVLAWVRPEATADHSADEHWAEEMDVMAGNIVAGTGFTVYGKTRNQRLYGRYTVAWQWAA